MDTDQGKVVEVIPSLLFWTSDTNPPVRTDKEFYFCIDKELKYHPYFSDFGPFNIAKVVRFVIELEKMLEIAKEKGIVIFHYTSTVASERLNAALLMGAFMVC
jgi:hypothetical protein